MILDSTKLRSIIVSTVFAAVFGAAAAQAEEYGPPNLLKTMKTPFGSAGKDEAETQETSKFAPIAITGGNNRRLSLSQRLVPTRLYLPGRMILGRSCEFSVKAKPGSWVALAMADKNSGAKPILGHTVKLGADRKLVALGQVPETGVISLNVETPVQGDLIGQYLYFEAVIWSKPDFSDVEFATAVRYDEQGKENDNGVLIAAEGDTKKGIKIVPNTAPLSPLLKNAGTSLGNNAGRP
ncbi:MAG: hypothetical protein EKK48_22530 [Candidatus Melainabacteria bacterium]|nr:MAG: hypothetical protein EKK48_22530 [Candidatus Melainabacteria bacterium]